jgi:hypothetical protein
MSDSADKPLHNLSGQKSPEIASVPFLWNTSVKSASYRLPYGEILHNPTAQRNGSLAGQPIDIGTINMFTFDPAEG